MTGLVGGEWGGAGASPKRLLATVFDADVTANQMCLCRMSLKLHSSISTFSLHKAACQRKLILWFPERNRIDSITLDWTGFIRGTEMDRVD